MCTLGTVIASLHMASSKGHAEVACILFKHVANATTQDQVRSTPPHLASTKKLAVMLLERGASATAQGQEDLIDPSVPDFIQGRCRSRADPPREWHSERIWGQRDNRIACGIGPGRGHVEVAQTLLDHCADMTATSQLAWNLHVSFLGVVRGPIFYKSGAGFARSHEHDARMGRPRLST